MVNHFFISQLSKKLLRNHSNQFSRPIVKIAVSSLALGFIIMILAVAITGGYKRAIQDKVIGIGSHIRISNYDMNYSFEPTPISKDQPFLEELYGNADIENIQFYSTKVGIIKTDDQVEGVVLKGIDSTFCWKLFNNNMIAGSIVHTGNAKPSSDIILSKKMSQKLHLKIGDKVRTYFVQNPPMQRSFKVVGIYETGLPEYDDKFAIVDLRQVQKLNQWDSSMVGGIEVLINDYDNLDKMGVFINDCVGYNLKAETIKQIYPEIFEWIALFDTNVAVLMIIIIIICIITIISTFFIIILEQTQNIGILKAMGMQTQHIVILFAKIAATIIFKGMVIGNAVAVALCLIQKYFHVIKLDAASYYVDYIPVAINIPFIAIIDAGMFVLCLSVLMVPARIIAQKMSPVKAIRFD